VAGSSDRIGLHGLLLDGVGSGATGILVGSAGELDIQDCVICRFTFSGIDVEPTSAMGLAVSATRTASNGRGLRFVPTGAGAFTATIDHLVSVDSSLHGIEINGIGMTGGTLSVAITDSVSSNNSGDGLAVTSGFTTRVAVQGLTAVNNVNGVSSSGVLATVLITKSMISGNATGFATSSSGVIDSYGDNLLDGNTANGSATNTFPLH
jgi:hypothetical protein